MPLAVLYDDRAWKDLQGLPKVNQARVHHRVVAYAADSDSTAHDVVPLRGSLDGFRLRVGDWRVLFQLTENTMRVRRVVHRREACR